MTVPIEASQQNGPIAKLAEKFPLKPHAKCTDSDGGVATRTKLVAKCKGELVKGVIEEGWKAASVKAEPVLEVRKIEPMRLVDNYARFKVRACDGVSIQISLHRNGPGVGRPAAGTASTVHPDQSDLL